MASLIELFTSGVGASMLGAIGAVVTRSFDFVNRKEQYKHDIQMRNMDFREMQYELTRKVDIAEKTAEGEVAKAQLASMSIARSASSDKFGITWVDALRGSLPAFITIYFVALMTMWGLMTYDETIITRADIFKEIVSNTIFLTVAYCCFWIGVNPPKRK